MARTWEDWNPSELMSWECVAVIAGAFLGVASACFLFEAFWLVRDSWSRRLRAKLRKRWLGDHPQWVRIYEKVVDAPIGGACVLSDDDFRELNVGLADAERILVPTENGLGIQVWNREVYPESICPACLRPHFQEEPSDNGQEHN